MSLLRHGLAAVLLAAAATQVAAAPTPASVQVDELTWTELRDAIKAGKTTVIVPVGGTEQSGPHIALGKHNVRARALAARSLRQAGFRDIVLIGDHGGYQASLARVAAKLDREWATSTVRVHAIGEYYRAAERDFAQALRKQGFSEAEIGTHAGAADTSLSLAVDEQLVRSALLHDGSALGPANGVHGDPRRASAAAGRAGIDLIVARTRDAIQREVARR